MSDEVFDINGAASIRISDRSPQPVDPQALTAADIFSAAEEHFLRAYTEGLVRLQAMLQAFPRRKAPDIQEVAALESEAGRLISRAEQLPWPALASAVGLDRLYFLARLRKVCDSEEGHISIKGLQVLCRVYGLSVGDSDKGGGRQTALVFNFGNSSSLPELPVSRLPFAISGDAYRVFTEPPADEDTENDSPGKPK